MRAVVLVVALLVAGSSVEADDGSSSKDGPGLYVGLSYRVGRTKTDFDRNKRWLHVFGVAAGARYRYRCLEAGLGLAGEVFDAEGQGQGRVLSAEAYVLRDVSTNWALGGHISAGGGDAHDDVNLGDGFVGTAGLRARHRGVLSLALDAYVIHGHDETLGGVLVGARVTGDVFRYGYTTAAIGAVLAAAIIVFAVR